MCDFETTVYKGQENTEVWASASVELYTEKVEIFHSIDEQYNYFLSLNSNVIAYYHNLKFDGAFWLSYLLIDKGFKQATNKVGESEFSIEWQSEKNMKNKTFKYSVSDKGQWYTIIIKDNNHFIEIRDSLKLLPFIVMFLPCSDTSKLPSALTGSSFGTLSFTISCSKPTSYPFFAQSVSLF